jgi:periplasmic protein TonB
MMLTQGYSDTHAADLHQAIARIQPSRIFGMAGAIALNVAAFMLLLVPVSAPMPSVLIDEEKKPITWIEPKPVVIEHKPTVVPVQKTTETKPTQTTKTTTPTQTVVHEETVIPDGTEYTLPTNTEPTTDLGPALPQNPDPLPSMRLEYASAPAPTYPRDMLLDGREGTVVLRVLVDVDGKPLSVEIERSSGHRKLDDAARRQVLRKWMFRPAMRDGQAVQVYGIVPVSFSLSLQ